MERKKLPKSFWALLIGAVFIVIIVGIASIYDWLKTIKFDTTQTDNKCIIVIESKVTPQTNPILFDWDRFENNLSILALHRKTGEVQTQKVLSSTGKYLIYKLNSLASLCESQEQDCATTEIKRIRKNLILFNRNISNKTEWNLQAIPVNNNFTRIPLRDCGPSEAGKNKFFYNEETYKLFSLDLKNSQFSQINLESFLKERLKEKLKPESIDASINIQSRLIANGGMLNADCLKANRALSDGFMFSNSLVIWPKKIPQSLEEIWVYRESLDSGTFRWLKGEGFDTRVFKDGYIAKMSQFSNYLLVSFFDTVKKKYTNYIYRIGDKTSELSTLFFSDGPVKFATSPMASSNLIYESGKSPQLLTFVAKKTKVIPLIKLDKKEFTNEAHIMADYQNNSILLIDNSKAAEKNVYQLSCQSIE